MNGARWRLVESVDDFLRAHADGFTIQVTMFPEDEVQAERGWVPLAMHTAEDARAWLAPPSRIRTDAPPRPSGPKIETGPLEDSYGPVAG